MRGREGENIKRQTKDNGWTTVQRGRQRFIPANRSLSHKQIIKKDGEWSNNNGYSVFVDNLPTFYDSILLKKLFQRYGRITNTHMSWKRRIKNDTYFGFVNFEKEEEGLKAIKNLDGVIIFGFKICVKWSYSTKKKKVDGGKWLEKEEGGLRDGRSYADVAARNKQEWKKKGPISSSKGRQHFNEKPTVIENSMMLVSKLHWKEMEETTMALREKIMALEEKFSQLREEIAKWKVPVQSQAAENCSDDVDDVNTKRYSDEHKEEEDDFSGSKKEDEESSKVAGTVVEETENVFDHSTPTIQTEGKGVSEQVSNSGDSKE